MRLCLSFVPHSLKETIYSIHRVALKIVVAITVPTHGLVMKLKQGLTLSGTAILAKSYIELLPISSSK